ncbi:MAG: PAS domain S-box protein [bacterium]|nr:PAS domain S-box protein [bacterium]
MTAHDPYRELFERSADAILIIEGDVFIECNAAAVRMLRCGSREEVLRTHPSELSPPLQPDGRPSFEKANEMIALAFERGSHRFEWAHRRADGEIFPVEVLLTPVREEKRTVLHVVWRDITERRELEERLRHSQKMEAVGKLAGGIAHDFNNLLVVILGHADLLEQELGQSDELQQHVNAITTASLRAAEMVRQLLAFGRRQALTLRVIDLNELVRELKNMLQRLIGEDLKLVAELTGDDVCVVADRTQLERVLMNIASNARDAMPRGGTLTLSTRRLRAPGDPSSTQLAPGDYVRL